MHGRIADAITSDRSRLGRRYVWLGATTLATAAALHLTSPASAQDPCALVGMFNASAKAACQAAAKLRRQNQTQTQSARTPREQEAVPVTSAPMAVDDRPAAPNDARTPSTMPSAAAGGAGRRGRPVQTTPVANISDDGHYTSGKFNGLSTWRDLFAKAANSPAEWATIRAKMTADGNGGSSVAYGMVNPGRNYLQKLLTDYDTFTLYHRDPKVLLAKQQQCLAPRTYSADEACDCLAGFPGDTQIGPGAGELVMGSNHSMAIKACGAAADATTDPKLKARYLAQRARAQVYTMDPAQAGTWADEAVQAGYRRATIIRPEAYLRDIEVLAGAFPPMTQAQYDKEVRDGLQHLKTAKATGVRESYIVAIKYNQTIARLKFNSSVLTPMVKAMMAPPPRTPCGPDSRDNEGKPIAGSGCIGHTM